ncbi:putative O-linked N-acetylglucosamine transferase (SPINDLY family) [Caulobacter ginsengisoli]|uniref:protein O-GlcNAc transferase n=1 Tax=Caulobacter ginsengisoli TaxID=400775 RepID=A0ABU0IUN6_9CAUL|nr:tetratricopeptide repeat protein [Caulobacter ginsengisoli]MDQ0465709.1 putative O-linked N-acetylglucosamine transferase (SPINDLY family) [Caulobacter ginsengisoli]
MTDTAPSVPALMGQAIAAFQQGRLDETRAACDRVLSQDPDFFDALHLLGVTEARAGGFAIAELLLGRALRQRPDHTEVALNLANLLREQRRHPEAIAAYDALLARQAKHPAAWLGRGRSLAALGHPADAVAAYDLAIAANPKNDEALYFRALSLKALGRLPQALASYDAAIALRPGFAAALCNRGNLLRDLKRWDEAAASLDAAIAADPKLIAAHIGRAAVRQDQDDLAGALADLDRACALAPGYAEALANRAVVLIALGRHDEALADCDRVLGQAPDDIAALRSRGTVMAALNRHEEAVACFDKVLAAQPDDLSGLVNRGSALRQLGRHKAALVDYDRALVVSPDQADALNNRGNVLRELGRNAEAAIAYGRLYEIHPQFRRVLGNRTNAELLACDWRNYPAAMDELAQATRAGEAVDMPFAFLAHSTDPADQLACAANWTRDRYPAAAQPLWTGERYKHDRIRLAYLSADFHYHPMAHLMMRLFETHDRDRFEVTALSFGPASDHPIRKRLEAAFDRFEDVSGLADLELARRVRELEIDIAIDRKGFTQNARTGVFALRPAPLQVNYLAYPGGMGAPYIDYLIADPVIVRPGDERFYQEQVVRLPDTYQATDDRRAIDPKAPSRSACGLPETGFVFCCFNNNYKILPPLYDVWMRLLKATPGSVLWLLGKDKAAEVNLKREAEARGVSGDRIVFGPYQEMGAHLARHAHADLFLDTFPFNAHTTASDALWAGLPVLTCEGQTFASRVAASVLTAVGLPELIVDSFEAYEATALRLATHPAELATLKARLAANRTTTALFDSDRFRRHYEAALVTMHERQMAGLPPEAFDVAPIQA